MLAKKEDRELSLSVLFCLYYIFLLYRKYPFGVLFFYTIVNFVSSDLADRLFSKDEKHQ